MALIKEEDKTYLIQQFQKLSEPVTLMLFTQAHECQYCTETRQIAEELAGLSPKINLQVLDLLEDKESAEKYNIDKIPALLILRGTEDPHDYGIRFFGVPAGYEFNSMIEAILMVSGGDSGLSAQTREAVAKISQPVHLQVFITPT